MRYGYRNNYSMYDRHQPVPNHLLATIKYNVQQDLMVSVFDISKINQSLINDLTQCEEIQSFIDHHDYQLFIYLDKLELLNDANTLLSQLKLSGHRLIIPASWFEQISQQVGQQGLIVNDQTISIEEAYHLALSAKLPLVLRVKEPMQELTDALIKKIATLNRPFKTNLIIYRQKRVLNQHTLDLQRLIKDMQQFTSDFDLIVDMKDRSRSAIKAKNALTKKRKIQLLEQEWACYKYLVLAKSPLIYNQIRALLKSKADYPLVTFYKLIDEAMNAHGKMGYEINAAMHVWGYFKDSTDPLVREQFNQLIMNYMDHQSDLKTIKSFLYQQAVLHQSTYLLNSYYFL